MKRALMTRPSVTMDPPADRPTGSAAGDAGWTLLEMLVAMALLALTTALLAAAISGARTGFTALERRTSDSRSEAVQTHLRHAISQMRPLRPAGAPETGPLIEAAATSLGFVSSYSPAGQFGGIYFVQLGLQARSDGYFDLFETRSLFRTAAQPGTAATIQPGIRSPLLPAIADIRFQYYGQAEEGEPPSWSTSWTARTKLPQLVSVQINFPPGDRRSWPTFVVAVPSSN